MEALNPEDITIETFADAWPDIRMKITHLPTMISVEATSFNHERLKDWLLEKLRVSLPKKTHN